MATNRTITSPITNAAVRHRNKDRQLVMWLAPPPTEDTILKSLDVTSAFEVSRSDRQQANAVRAAPATGGPFGGFEIEKIKKLGVEQLAW